MRQQGRLSDWKDDRGFGFITPQGGGSPVFVHLSAFERGQVRPILNAEVTFEIQVDPKKGSRAVNVAYAGGGKTRSRSSSPSQRRTISEYGSPQGSLRRTWRNTVLTGTVLLGLGGYAWQQFNGSVEPNNQEEIDSISTEHDAEVAEPRFQCEGKQHCSQMRSCEEAQFYVAHCPDTLMDGDNDGRACEDVCGH